MPRIKELRKRKLPSSHLLLGMYVCEVDKPWEETTFLFQGFPLLSHADIDAVQQQCEYVYVDDTRFVAVTESQQRHVIAESQDDEDKSRRVLKTGKKPLSQTIEHARAVHQRGSDLIKSALHDIQLGRGLDVKACKTYVSETVEQMLSNESAMLWFMRLKSQDEYTSQHCLSVSLLCIGFARFLGYDKPELKVFGLAGLLHDVGKMKVDLTILNKPGKLSSEEFEHMKSHAQRGYELLLSHKDLPSTVVDVTYAHHERLDGTGYPRGLTKEQIPQRAFIVSICDVYDAITSHRVYDTARPPMEALKVLMKGRGSQFDDKLVVQFIEWLGVFPVGTLVRLHTDECGIVLESNATYRLRPVVVLLRDANGKPCTPRRLNLAQVCVAPDGNPYKISESIADGSFGLHANSDEVKALLQRDVLEKLAAS